MKKLVLASVLAGVCAAAFAAEIPRAPDGTFSDRANLISADAARMIRIREDFVTRASGCPLYVATFGGGGGRGRV